ncbi:MAG: TetR/AcrR family transcriptional regulator [Candidatus Riflebacteria bacterium]|nr:TetR/AcrR family transcriptional regulator [Candidatus Riflebacteria bacterium]
MARPASDKRGKIISAATKCFSTQSFQDVKLDKVAEEAGVAKGTIYLYFRNKEDLFCECLIHDNADNYQRAEDIISEKATASVRLKKLVELQDEIYQKKGPLVQQMIQMAPALPISPDGMKILHDHLRRIIDQHSRLFQQGIDSGEFSSRFSADQMAVIFVQIFDLKLKFQMFHIQPLTPEDIFDSLIKMFDQT